MDLDPTGDIHMRFLVGDRAERFCFGAKAASHSNRMEAFFHASSAELDCLPNEQELA